jgi:hypothetical protein
MRRTVKEMRARRKHLRWNILLELDIFSASLHLFRKLCWIQRI